jgi:hypothetical protein
MPKLYGATSDSAKGRYSPADCTGIIKTRIVGKPDPAHISTSFIERQKLTMRMHMRRFTRLTNAFSKKVESYAYVVAFHTMYYNFVKIHTKLRTSTGDGRQAQLIGSGRFRISWRFGKLSSRRLESAGRTRNAEETYLGDWDF